jgi:hypothetical protein
MLEFQGPRTTPRSLWRQQQCSTVCLRLRSFLLLDSVSVWQGCVKEWACAGNQLAYLCSFLMLCVPSFRMWAQSSFWLRYHLFSLLGYFNIAVGRGKATRSEGDVPAAPWELLRVPTEVKPGNTEQMHKSRNMFIWIDAVFFCYVIIATGWAVEGPEFRVPVGARFFSSPRRLDWFWAPPSLLSNWYWG